MLLSFDTPRKPTRWQYCIYITINLPLFCFLYFVIFLLSFSSTRRVQIKVVVVVVVVVSVCLSVCVFAFLFVCLFVCPSICLSVCLSVCLPVFVYQETFNHERTNHFSRRTWDRQNFFIHGFTYCLGRQGNNSCFAAARLAMDHQRILTWA